MLEEMLGHLDAARSDEARAGAGPLLDRPHGPLGRRRRPRAARRGRPGPPDAALRPPLRRADRLSPSRRSPPATARASAAGPRSPSPATCGSAAPTCACASPAPRWASRSGPARLVTLCGLAVAKYLLLTAQEVGADEALRLGPGQPGRARRRDRGGGARARRRGRRAPARGGRPPEADAARVGRRRGPLARRGRGPGRVAALRPRAPSRRLQPRLVGSRGVILSARPRCGHCSPPPVEAWPRAPCVRAASRQSTACRRWPRTSARDRGAVWATSAHGENSSACERLR